MRDFEAYDAGGAVWNAGGNPYSTAIWHAERTLPGVDAGQYAPLPFVAPPAALPLLGSVARVPAVQANALWRVLLLLSAALLAFCTLRLAGLPRSPGRLLAIAVAMLGFGPLTSSIALGQLALPAFACAAAAQIVPAAGFFAWLQPNVALVTLADLARRGRVLRALLPAAGFAAVCAAVAGRQGLLHYAAIVHAQTQAERFSGIQITPEAIAYGLGAPATCAIAIGAAVAVAAAGSYVAFAARATEATARFCAACALLPLAMPFFHEQDLIVVFVPAIVAVQRASARALPLALCGALLAATDWLGLAQRPGGALQSLLLTGACAAALLTFRERVTLRTLAAPVATLAALAIVAAFARAHPAPVWPDAMGPLRGVRGVTAIAAVWHLEQQATGLFVRNAVWSLLRLLSLMGCVLIAASIAISSRYPQDSRSPLPAPA